MNCKCTTIDEITRQYRRFNTVGTKLTVRLLPQLEEDERDPISTFVDSMTNLCEHALWNCDDSDMVGISILSKDNMRDKAM